MNQYYEGEAVIQKSEVTKPRPRKKDGKPTIVLYDRVPCEGDPIDYIFENVKSADRKKVKVMMPFAGAITVSPKFKIEGIMNKESDKPSLQLLLENGGYVDYENEAGFLSQFVISEDGSSISWDFKEDWGTWLDLSCFNAKNIVDLCCQFTLIVSVLRGRIPLRQKTGEVENRRVNRQNCRRSAENCFKN